MSLLSAEGITVRFGGLYALREANIDVTEGRITGLIGPNGAGKTTLFNVITGLQQATAGRVMLGGDDITETTPYKRARLGIARTFQKLEAFNSLSTRDNIRVAAQQRRAWDKTKFNPNEVTEQLLQRIGLADVAEFMVGILPTGTARLVELARALATNPKVLLLDEPSSGLNEDETDEMAAILRDLVADGLAVLLVEHDMSFVMNACEHIHVLDFGRVIATGSPIEVQGHADVQAAYLGTAATEGVA
jgi:branched-chain amino acid transport system ATP-binding protein